MATTCEVCSKEPAKYRCPTCHLQSCSLACTQSHKASCSAKAPKPGTGLETQNGTSAGISVDSEAASGLPPATKTTADTIPSSHSPKAAQGFAYLESSQALKDILARFPGLRSQLREIYRLTLEEEWVEMRPAYHGRAVRGGRGRGGYGSRGGRSRGPWTEEKGFNRGLGKVRRLRESFESGLVSGPDAEGFGQFASLVLADHDDAR
ncbi:hypothetical protein FQN55_005504 [Onygenales sp. PD_40]|nr:hypothetical protein FQN55_005504 [Onygenales sp. PD_40]KAK2797945.1 hypothetical protein FQN51_008124 [Onygenales sp. PD_10]